MVNSKKSLFIRASFENINKNCLFPEGVTHVEKIIGTFVQFFDLECY